MSAKLDFSQFKQYKEDFAKANIDFDDWLKDFLMSQANRLMALVKPKTPVGTPESTGIPGYIGGSLRQAWQLGEIKGAGQHIEVEILNGMEYATEVEYGHRVMGGAGHTVELWFKEGVFMLTTSMDEIRKRMPMRFGEQFTTFCKQHGIGE